MTKYSESRSHRDREAASWMPSESDDVARRVGNDLDSPLHVKTKELVQGVDYDLITATYPSSTTEIYTYTLSSVVVLVATVVYTSSDKRDISTVSFT